MTHALARFVAADGLGRLRSRCIRAGTAAQGQEEIATYHNKRFGFTLSYPTAQFKPKEPLSDDGRVWMSHDGNARLLAGALPNADGMNLRDYREFLLKESYAGADDRLCAGAGHVVRAVGHARRHDLLRARDLHVRRAR